LEATIGSWTIDGSVTIFDGDETRCFDSYRILQGAEIWQSDRSLLDLTKRLAPSAAWTASR
jgi:hypothetical protein